MAGSSIPPPPPHASAQIQEDLEHASSTTYNISNAVIRGSEQGGIEAVRIELHNQRHQRLLDYMRHIEQQRRRKQELRKAIVKGDWSTVVFKVMLDSAAITEEIKNDGNTLLHIAVGLGQYYLVKNILANIEKEKLPEMRNSQGSTALHIAAMVGNTDAAKLLIEKNPSLLEMRDENGETPLAKAYENMHLDTIEYLLQASDDGKTKKKSSTSEDSLSLGPDVKIGVDLVVNAVSAKQYCLATILIEKYPGFAVENDNVLMELARTFPSGLDYWETLIYPSMEENFEWIVQDVKDLYLILVHSYKLSKAAHRTMPCASVIWRIIATINYVILEALFWILHCIFNLICMVLFSLSIIYYLLWKISSRKVAYVKNIEKKKKELEDAKKILILVCDEIDKLTYSGSAHQADFYNRPILEAAGQDAYEVVDEILMRFPDAIECKDENGHDIIQLAVIHRSEKIYNLIYLNGYDIIGERRSLYRMLEDSLKNNMLHLAGRLAPTHKLKLRTGAALQLQRELQWREEVKKLVFPAYITRENRSKETPDMIFTKEHEPLVKEGEKWMRAVAESCSITAALIVTIVFAAAITVPGGSNENTGIPLFRGDIAFIIFGISDAISLFASTTALMVFQSILIGRFSEQDFLVRLPRRLIIGLSALLISTAAMMVAFGTILFLVFCHKKPWMLAPICVLAFLPVAFYAALQIPLMLDLFQSTNARIFGNQINRNNRRFNPDRVYNFFGK